MYLSRSFLKLLIFLIVLFTGSYCFAATETVPGNSTVTLQVSGDNVAFAGNGVLNIPAGFNLGSTDGTSTGVSATNAGINTGTLNFVGDSNVVGTVGASSALSEIEYQLGFPPAPSSTLTFDGTVAVGTIGLLSQNTTTIFNSNVNCGLLQALSHAAVVLGPGVTFTGVMEFGNLTFKGNNIFNGNVGASGNILDAINVDGNATINGTVDATNINFNNVATLTLNGNTTATTTTSSANTGILNLGDGVLFTGDIGTSSFPLSRVNVSAASSASITGTIFSNNIGFLGTGSTITLDGNTTSILDYGSYNGTAIIAANRTFTGAATTATAGTGILQLNSNSIYAGSVGTSSLPLGSINVSGNSSISGVVNTDEINFISASSLTLNENTFANAFTTTTNTGVLNLGNTVQYMGNIGTSSSKLSAVNVSSGSSATITGNIFATTIGFLGAGSTITLNGNTTAGLNYGTNNGTAILGPGSILTGATITSTANTGVLTLGGGSTYNGSIGTSSNYLNMINLTGNAAINGAIVSKNFVLGSNILTQTGSITLPTGAAITSTVLSDTSYGRINAAGSSLTFPSVMQINMQINNGTLLSGTPFYIATGDFGSQALTINVASNNANYAFKGLNRNTNSNILVYPTLIVTPNYTTQFIPETTTASLIASDYDVVFSGDGNAFPSDGVLNVPNNFDLGSINTADSVTTFNDGKGTINFLGNSTVNGNIGSQSLKLKEISGGAAGTSITFDGTVNATRIDFNNASTMTLNGDTVANIFTATTNTGVLNLGTVQYSGNIGTPISRLNTVNIKANSSATVNSGVVRASTIGFLGSGAELTLNGSTAFGNVSTAADTGTLNLNNGSLIVGTVGTSSNFLHQISINSDATIFGSGASKNINLGAYTLLMQSGDLTFPSGSAITVEALSNSSYGNIDASGGAINFTNGLLVNMQTSTLLDPNIPMQVVTGNSGTFGPGSAPITTTSNNARFTFTGLNPAGTGNVLIYAHLVPSVLPPGSIAAGAAAAFDAAAIGATGDMLFVQNQVTALNDANAIAAAEAQFAPVVNGGDAFMSMAALNQFQHFWQSNLTKVRNAKLAGAKIVQVRHPSERFVYHNEKNSYCSSNADEIWVDGFGYFANQRDHMQVPGYNGNMYGLVGAFQRTLEQWQLGLGLGYAYTNVDGKGSQISSSSIDTIGGTVYLGYNSNAAWFLDGLFTFAWNHYKDSRDIIFPGLNRTAQGDYDGKEYSLLFSGGYNCATNYGFIFTPLASLQFLNLKIDEYTETGANALDLIQQNQEYNLIQASAGLMVGLPVRFDFGTLYSEVHVNFLYDLVNDQIKNASQFFGGGPLFNTYGLTPALGQINLGVSSTIFRARSLTLKLSYEVNWATNFTGQRGGITICFTPF